VESTESERHPDLSIYVATRPALAQPWQLWVPEVVVEIVSESSRKRDYQVKPDEYLAFGVKEYWLIDPAKSVMVAHIRVGGLFQKKLYKPGQKYKTHILPRFVLDISKLLAAANR
jgi:Uma2 family endonuclease